MVDKEMALTFSIRNNPGVYALLLGSGVSTDAGVPTGWGVVVNLIGKLAEVEGEDIDSAPVEWYREQYNSDPDYDDLLEQIAPSREERQSLLEKYFEPTEEEREEGIKTPSDAHRSIAWLVDEGYVNVIVTTNFDRLLEHALSERGVNPVVVSSISDAEGAAPVAHQDAVILKVNGDYKETNIKNITEELEEYETEIEELLDQIFDEYGLIVSGWSSEYDVALREALLRCQSRRYSTFWAYHGSLEVAAEELVAHRDAIPIQIDDASSFFYELKENVQALKAAESGAPLTREVARERVKRYMAREERRIDLADLLNGETELVYPRLNDDSRYPLTFDDDDEYGEVIEERLEEYEAEVMTLLTASTTCAFWGPEVPNSGIKPLGKSLRRIGSLTSPRTFTEVLNQLRRYPASLLLYGMGVAAVESNNWSLLYHLLVETNIKFGRLDPISSVIAVHPSRAGGEISLGMRSSTNFTKRRIKNAALGPVAEFIPEDERYENQFHWFEAFADLVLYDRMEHESVYDPFVPDGLYPASTLEEMADAIEREDDEWAPIRTGFFDGSVSRADTILDEFLASSPGRIL